jgi:hypothetical protein
MYDLLHEKRPYHDGSFSRWAKESSRQFPFHYLDGVTIWLAPVDMNPDDDFLSESVAGESPDDVSEADEG